MKATKLATDRLATLAWKIARPFIQLTNRLRTVLPAPASPTSSRCPMGWRSTRSMRSTCSRTPSNLRDTTHETGKAPHRRKKESSQQHRHDNQHVYSTTRPLRQTFDTHHTSLSSLRAGEILHWSAKSCMPWGKQGAKGRGLCLQV